MNTQQLEAINSILSDARAVVMCERPTMQDASRMLSSFVNKLMRLGLSYEAASARVDREVLPTLLEAHQ